MQPTPLSGLRVLDLTTMISGPFATSLMADFGADVVAVEHPRQPNPVRSWNPQVEGESLWWASLGRNKRCVTLDLSTAAGRDVVLELAAGADIVVENFRPGTMERWDLGYETLRAANEGVVMVRLSGYGQTGPRAAEPGFGSIAEAMSGFAHTNGFPDGPPLLPPMPLADQTAAMFAVMATMFAIYERDIGGSGAGQVVDVSLFEPLFRLFVSHVEGYSAAGEVPGRTGNRSTNSAPRNMYETADGYLALSASSQRIFENVAGAIDRPELVDDPRFATNEARLEHVEELDSVVEAWTRERSTEAAVETMGDAGAIVGPVYDVADVFEDEQYAARGALVELEHDRLGPVTTQGVVPTLSRTPGGVAHLGPAHGEHNEAVYVEELGMARDRLEALRADDVV